MSTTNVSERIRQFIVENFLYTQPDSPLGEDDSLLGNGIIDSMGVMELIAFLEEEFSVVLADAEITLENLGTLRRVTRCVTQHLATEAAA